jgi:hypothetical protein
MSLKPGKLTQNRAANLTFDSDVRASTQRLGSISPYVGRR